MGQALVLLITLLRNSSNCLLQSYFHFCQTYGITKMQNEQQLIKLGAYVTLSL